MSMDNYANVKKNRARTKTILTKKKEGMASVLFTSFSIYPNLICLDDDSLVLDVPLFALKTRLTFLGWVYSRET